MSWEVISGVCAIIGVLGLVYQFGYLPKKEKEKEIEAQNKSLDHIRILWKSSESKLDKLISDLTEYAYRTNSGESLFQMSITFNAQLRQLRNLKESDFKAEHYKGIADFSISKEVQQTAALNLQKQIDAFTQLQAYFDGAFKFK